MLGLPCWAALSAGNLGGSLVLPAEVRSVVITVIPIRLGVTRRVLLVTVAGEWSRVMIARAVKGSPRIMRRRLIGMKLMR